MAKVIKVSDETYYKIKEIAKKERRCIKTIVDMVFEKKKIKK